MKIVQKYGGSSLADEICIRRVVDRIREDRKRGQVLAVVSAQGKTTDQLTGLYNGYRAPFPSRESDALLTTGEQTSAALLSAALESGGLPAVSLNAAQVPIIAYGGWGDARIVKIGTDRIKREWSRGKVVVVTGFQGVNAAGDLITLGRGGSDTSAVALAAALKADECRVFTDVEGVFSVDPRIVSDAVRFEELSPEEMLEFAQKGAKVLHPRAAALALRYHVPLEILTSFRRVPGTRIVSGAPRRAGIAAQKRGETGIVSMLTARPPDPELRRRAARACGIAEAQVQSDAGGITVRIPWNERVEMLARLHQILYP